MKMQAIILAGGFGKRLRSVIQNVPKPMAPIHDKPFLAYLIDYLIKQGIQEVVLSVHYLREQIQDYFKNDYQGVKIDYAIETEPLGTGGAIQHAFTLIKNSDPVFILNGDTFLKLNYQTMFAQHKQQASALTIALREIKDCSRYGSVSLKDNQIIAFKEKGDNASGWINAGVYLTNKKIFESYHLPAQFSFETDFLFPHIKQLKPHAFYVNDFFIDIGVPEDYQKAISLL